MNWLHYLIEANLYLVVFYLAYSVLLAKDTHYQLNRVFLLLSSAVAFVLPLIQLNFLKPTAYVYEATATYMQATASSPPLWQAVLFDAYLAGVLVLATGFAIKLIRLKRLKKSGTIINSKDHHLVHLKGSNTAFSFFNYLFIGDDTGNESLIIRHELVHIRQKHSADVLFMELLKIINWFNPVVYLLQRSIRTQHEYLADEQTALATHNTVAYASFLLNNAYGLSGPAITHSFFNQNLLKKRIIMLDQKRSGSLARLKYLVAVPLCAALLAESTLGFSKSYGFIGIGQQKTAIVSTTDTAKKFKIVPDGHKGSNKKGKKGTMVIKRDTVVTMRPTQAPTPPKNPAGKSTALHGTPTPPLAKNAKVKVTDVILTPPPPPPLPAKKTSGKKKVIITDVILTPPPPPPLPSKKADTKPVQKADIRIDEPVKTTAKPTSEIRIDEPVVTSDKKISPDIRIDNPAPVKKP
ncbi:M56 family metallopeptidase [Mucilaginibacter sp. dw_454]|uniref:M56 family metallopeptidase n=1 Tax=Mucilaginibacter sp. dw_454 TaxID=2720079 RepID=UPI001BD3FE19|nr:M56 family metallopeptidase [Mucilaginibacter sp. dw_454]